MRYQTTISEPVEFIGRDIFRGGEGRMTIYPSEYSEGAYILYKGESTEINLQNARAVKDLGTRFASTIAILGKDFRILMPEHVLPAIYFGAGIDNFIIELEQDSFPRFNWGMKEVVERLEGKVISLNKPTREVRPLLTKHYNPESEYDKVSVQPAEDELKITYNAYYPHKSVGQQTRTIDINPEGFAKIMEARGIFFVPFGNERLSRFIARLIGFPDEITHENTLMIGRKSLEEYLSTPGSLGKNEFVSHKIIDALAAVALKSLSYKARITNAHFEFGKTGHQTDLEAMRHFGFIGNEDYEVKKAIISPPSYGRISQLVA